MEPAQAMHFEAYQKKEKHIVRKGFPNGEWSVRDAGLGGKRNNQEWVDDFALILGETTKNGKKINKQTIAEWRQ